MGDWSKLRDALRKGSKGGLDELIDGGIILETDPYALAKATETSGKASGDTPVSEIQNASQALNVAGAHLKRFLLT